MQEMFLQRAQPFRTQIYAGVKFQTPVSICLFLLLSSLFLYINHYDLNHQFLPML